MDATRWLRGVGRTVGGVLALAATSYAMYIGVAWSRYGHAKPPANRDEADPLLDQLMPVHDVVERHHIRVAAAAEDTLSAA